MKVFISADIEGTNGVCTWDETEPDKRFYPYFAEKMSREVAAVCEGINDAYQDADILVKDAHHTARNIDHALLPENVRLNRGWSGHPYKMMAGLDNSYDASMLTGYHSGGGYGGNPLAHTMSMRIPYLKMNGMLGSEFLMNYYTSLYVGVPLVLVAGDKMLCEFAKSLDPNIYTVPTTKGIGGSVTGLHPEVVKKELRKVAKEAVENRDKMNKKLPDHFSIEMRYREHKEAYKSSFYPGVTLIDAHTIGFETDDYYEFLRMFTFTF